MIVSFCEVSLSV